MSVRAFTILIASAMCCLLCGQEFRATITGHIMDSSGAAIPGVVVHARNTETNEMSSATSDAGGVYRIPFLRPGGYTLTAESANFKRYVREGLVLTVGQTAGVNITLQVGEVKESVTVTAETPLLETEMASRGGVVDQLRVTELPLNARTPWYLGGIMPGVSFRGQLGWQRPFDNNIMAKLTINGGIMRFNDFLIDGAPDNGWEGNWQTIAYVPIVDNVQEFRVQTNSYDAQYGHTSGGVMNAILKSGTNQFHATGWEFLRRTPLDTNTFQNNAVGAPKIDHSLDQWGFQLAGPMYLPKLYDGRNKSFFLGAFERYVESAPDPMLLSVPEPEFLQGDFSKLVNAAQQPVIIYNPYTGRAGPGGSWIRDPFIDNQIPPSMISPIAVNILNYWAKPNTTTPGSAYSQNNLSLPNNSSRDLFYNLSLRFDQNFGDKHRLFFRHSSSDRSEFRSTNGIYSGPGQGSGYPYQRLSDSYVLDWVGTVSPTLIVNARVSSVRYIQRSQGEDNAGFDLTTLGFPAATVNQLPGGKYFGNYTLQGYTGAGVYPTDRINNNYNLGAGVTKIWGSHSVHGGVDIRRTHIIDQSPGNVWSFSGNNNWTQRTYNLADATSGNSVASFLLGIPSGSSNYAAFPLFRRWYVAPFVQDDWKVTRRLTLNLGLRWDVNTQPDEKYNRLNSIFDPAVSNPVSDEIDATRFPQFADLKGGLTFAGVNGRPTRAANVDWNNFQARIGAAFRITNRVVLRGGFGVYYMDPSPRAQLMTGFSTSTPLVASLDDNRTPARTDLLSNPYPDGIMTPPGASQGPLTYVGRNFSWFNEDFVVPRMHQFSLGLQFQLTQSSMLDVSYVGSRGHKLEMSGAYNIPSLDFRKQCNILEGGSPAYCDAKIANPFKGIAAFAGTSFISASTLSRFQLNRPFPQFNGDLTQWGLNDGRTWYDSLQANYTLRPQTGLSLIINYTFSKYLSSMDYSDLYAKVLERGLSDADQPHVFKATAVYQLPFGRGKRFGGGASGFWNKVIGGWEWSNMFIARSGEPANLPSNVRILKDPKLQNVDWSQNQVVGWSPCVLRMDNNGNITPQQYSIAKGCGTDFSNYSWLVLPSYAPRETTLRSGQIRMRRAVTMDASLIKNVDIREGLRLQFGAEAFNLLNHFIIPYGQLNTNPNDANFGTIFPAEQDVVQTGFPRVIQLRFKVLW